MREGHLRGCIGPGSLESHIDHSEGFVRACPIKSPSVVMDLGSGGGIPGLVLAHRWPSARMILLDSSVRKAEFLRWAVKELCLVDHVSVVVSRAELLGRDPKWRSSIQVIVSRAFGKPAVVCECASPLLEIGGLLIVSDPPLSAKLPRWDPLWLEKLGMVAEETENVVGRFQVLRQVRACPENYPRRVGVPSKNPLF